MDNSEKRSDLNKKDKRKKIGNSGESRAAKYLVLNGYEIIERNFRTNEGEIDIIAKKNTFVVFVEIKTFPNGNMELLSHVLNSRKQKRIVKTAKRFLSIHRQYSNSYIRFDVIVLDMPGLPQVYHIENAFAETL